MFRAVLRPVLLVGCALALVVPAALVALGPITTFSNGTFADASAINGNFSALATSVQTLEQKAVRIVRGQGSFGTVNCNAGVVVLPGAVTFTATAGEWVTLETMVSGRANANGHLYGDIRLGGTNVTRFSAPSFENGGDWVRSMSGFVSRQITTTGSQTFQVAIQCGNGMSTLSDAGGEWPAGGVSYRVTIGG